MSTEREPGFRNAFGWNITGTAVGQLSGFAATIVLARSLPARDLAQTLAAVSFATIVSLACGLALDRVGVVALTREPARRNALARGLLGVSLLAAVVGVAVGAAASLLLRSLIPWSGWSVVAVAVMCGAEVVRTTVGDFPRAWLRTSLAVAFGTSGRAVLVLAISLALAAAGILDTAATALAVFASVSLVLGALAFIAVWTASAGARPDRAGARRIARGGAVTVGAFVARAALDQADVLVVTAAFSARTAAAYGVSTRIANAVAGMPAAVSLTVLPLLGRTRDQRGGGSIPLTRAASTLSAFVVVPVCIALAVAAPVLLRTLFGDGFDGGATILRLLLLGQIVSAVTGVSVTILVNSGRHVALLTLSIVLSGATLGVEIVVAQAAGAAAVAAVSTVGFVSLSLALAYMATRVTGTMPLAYASPRRAAAAMRSILATPRSG